MSVASAPSLALRIACQDDISEIVRITNAAYEVEAFCIHGPRTEVADVAQRMTSGQFLVVPDESSRPRLRGSVFMSVADRRGYLGLLAVDPPSQGTGVAGKLIAAVENECRRAGCLFVDLTVLSVRPELIPFYAKHGFQPSGVLPFSRPALLRQPLHLLQMTKPLHPGQAP